MALVFVLATTTHVALAKDEESDHNSDSNSTLVNSHMSTTTRSQDNMNGENDNSQDGQISEDASSTDSADRNHNQNDQNEAEQHHNKIENVAHLLKDLGSKDSKVKNDLESIANEEISSDTEANDAMNAVQNRNHFLSALFGADYKNIGVLRSTLVTTQNHIDQLSKAQEVTANAEVKAGIKTQILALQKANADAEAFILSHENSFSVFGWFIKLLNK